MIGAVIAAVVAVPLLVILIILPADNSCPTYSSDTSTPALDGYSDKQLALARMTIEIGRQRGISEHGITAALLAATTESDLRNFANTNVPESLRYDHDAVGSDHDSLGPWQIRASLHGAVGIAQLMNPTHQANWFYDQLEKIPDWPTMPPTALAQAVERSAKPEAYSHDIDRVAQLLSHLAPLIGIPSPACAQSAPAGDGFGHRVLAAAQPWVGTPYVWGGGDENGPTNGGFDCSGLVLYAVHAASGGQITLPHYTQAQQDDPRASIIGADQRRPGDLIYFTIPGQQDSHHVVIYAGDIDGTEMVLHAATFGVPLGYSPLSQWAGERWDIRRFGPAPDGGSGHD
ncbi:C40 family peptidase [Nocardia uniformis]|nr:C40 family peptidase [Nocardia uniformis]